MTENTCSVTDCARPIKRKGLCYGHYMKAWRYGTPTPTFAPKHDDLAGRTFGDLTVLARVGNAWRCACSCGAESITRSGDLNRGTASSCGDSVAHHRRDDIGYTAAHDRVRRDRGLVQTNACTDCGAQARHWSYDHADPNEMHATHLSANPIAYSNNPEHYEPRCVPCHKRFDLGRVDSATTRD